MIAGGEAGPGFWSGGVILVDQHSNRRGAQVDHRTNFIHLVRNDEATAGVAFIRVCPTPRLTRNVRRRAVTRCNQQPKTARVSTEDPCPRRDMTAPPRDPAAWVDGFPSIPAT